MKAKMWISDQIWEVRLWLAKRFVHWAHKLDDELGYDVKRAEWAEEICMKVWHRKLDGQKLRDEIYAAFY